MPAINTQILVNIKDQAPLGYPPIALVSIALVNGPTLYLASRSQSGVNTLSYGYNTYECRVSAHKPGPKQAQSSQGIDVVGTYSVDIADADYFYTQLEAQYGFQGAYMTVTGVAYDIDSNTYSADSVVLFAGLCSSPSRKQSLLTVSAIGTYDLNRKQLPDRPIQVTCPHNFPTTYAQRLDGNTNSQSPFWNCGYSPDAPSLPRGNSQGNGAAYTSCDKSKAQCVQRGMYTTDTIGHACYRFGGSQFQPPGTWKGKSYTGGKTTQGINSVNPAKYQDWCPETYGTTWVHGISANVVGDPNSTRGEVILSNGTLNLNGDIQTVGIQKVVYNNLLLPNANQTSDLLFRWYLITTGDRTGLINTSAIYNGQGDPYGSMCMIMPVVYSQVQASNSEPNVDVLIGARPIPVFTSTTNWTYQRTDNSAWVLLELCRRAGISYSAWDMNSVIISAAYCGQGINYTTWSGATASHRRMGVSISIDKPTSIATLVNGIKDGARLMIVPNAAGTALRMIPKRTLVEQQGNPVAGSNNPNAYPSYHTTDNPTGSPTGTGYFAYSFDETNVMEGTFELTQSSITQQANILTASIQDEDNDHTPDTVTMGDDLAFNRVGQKIQAPFSALGLPNYDQAARALQTKAFELYRANPRGDSGGSWIVSFTVSYRAIHLNQGDIVSLTWQALQMDHQAFRVIGIQLGSDFETAQLTLMWHDDRAYTDQYGQQSSPYFQTNGDFMNRPPYPWQPNYVGNVACDPIFSNGLGAGIYNTFDLQAGVEELPDSTIAPELIITGQTPINKLLNTGLAPRMGQQATISPTTGVIPDNVTVFVYVSAIDNTGAESALPVFPTVANVSGTGTNTNAIGVNVLYWPPNTVSYRIYAGYMPQTMALVSTGAGTPNYVYFGYVPTSGQQAVDTQLDHFILRAKHIVHGGTYVCGPAQGTGVLGANTITPNTITFGYVFSPDTNMIYTPGVNDFAGCTLMAVYQSGGGDIPFVNLKVASNNGFTFTIDMSLGNTDLTTLNLTQVWFVVLRQVAISGGNSVQFTDSVNTSSWPGLYLRVIGGTGMANGPMKIIAGNTTGAVALESAPAIALDSTSLVVVEEEAWRTNTPASSFKNSVASAAPTMLKYQFANLGGQFWFVEVGGANKNGDQTPDLQLPSRIFFWAGSPQGDSLLQGMNLFPNPALSLGPRQAGEIAAGWFVVQDDVNAWTPSLSNDQVYSGANSLKFSSGPITLAGAPNTSNPVYGPALQLGSSAAYPVPRPGESYYAQMAVRATPSVGIPANVELEIFLRMVVEYSDGTIDTANCGAGTAGVTGWSAWHNGGGTLTINPNKLPTKLYANIIGYWVNYNTGSTVVLGAGQSVTVWVGGFSLIRVIDVGTEATASTSSWLNAQGAIVPSEPINVSVTTNTNAGGSCTIKLTWASQSIQRGDQSYLTITAGTAQWSGLSPSTTYHFYMYANAADGSLHFGSGDPPSTPPTTTSQTAAMACSFDGRYPISPITVTTPASAGGGGTSGGGPGTCPDASEYVFEKTRGIIRVGDVKVGNFLRGRDLMTNMPVFRKVRSVEHMPSSTWYTVAGSRVSPMEQVMLPGKTIWELPFRMKEGELTPGPGTRVHIRVAHHHHDHQNYSLVDKETGADTLLLHNYLIQPC